MAQTKNRSFRNYTLMLCAVAIMLSFTARAQTNCSITTVTIQDGGNGSIFGGIVYLLVGFAALYFLPRLIGSPDVEEKIGSWKSLVKDAWTRGMYMGAILVYFVTGSWLYQNAADNGIEMTWLFEMLAYLISIVLAVMLIYMLLKLVSDLINMVRTYSDAERSGRNYRDD